MRTGVFSARSDLQCAYTGQAQVAASLYCMYILSSYGEWMESEGGGGGEEDKLPGSYFVGH